MSLPAARRADIDRQTAETQIKLRLAIDGSGQRDARTPLPFFNHMLDAFARHGLFDLAVDAAGDIEVDAHHTVEDVGLVLGMAFKQALGERRGIVRYGHAVIPMDEARAACSIDVSGRPYCACEGFERLPAGDIAGFEHEAAEEFFRAIASAARLTLHLDLEAGTNAHHMIEACFKAFARALRAAVAIDPRETGVPSTKGTLS